MSFMSEQPLLDPEADKRIGAIQNELSEYLKGGGRRKFSRFLLAALGGIPWFGGVLSASAALDAEKEQGHKNDLYRQWLEEYGKKVNALVETLAKILQRLSGFN